MHTSNTMGFILYLVPVSAAELSILTAISKPCPPFTAVCEKTSTVTLDFFSQAFAKNSLINNIFEEEKKFDSTHDFLGKRWFSYLVYLGQGEDYKLSTELSETVQYPHNKAIKNE